MDQINFIDFLKSLITETIGAVSEAQYEQEEKLIELKEVLLAPDEFIIAKYDLKEEALEVLGKKAEKEDITNYISEKIASLKQVLSTYFENGYVKTIVDKGTVDVKYICNINAPDPDTKPGTAKKNPKKKAGVTASAVKRPAKISPAVLRELARVRPAGVFKVRDRKIDKIARNIKIQTVDINKDKDLIKTSQNLVSSVTLHFRTVVVS